MGRLSGFKYREVARRLRSFGYIFDPRELEVTKSGGMQQPDAR